MCRLNIFSILKEYIEEDITPYDTTSNIDICGNTYGYGYDSGFYTKKFFIDSLDGTAWTESVEKINSYITPDTTYHRMYMESIDGACIYETFTPEL